MAILKQQVMVVFLSLFGAATLLMLSPVAYGDPPERNAVDVDGSGMPYAVGELLVTYREEISHGPLQSLDAEVDVREVLAAIDTELVAFPEIKTEPSEEARSRALSRIKEDLENNPAVESAEYNYLDTILYTPNDPRFGEQWNLRRPGFETAWNRTRGTGAKIGIVDSGIATRHPDLRRKIAAKRDFRNESTPNSVKDYIGHGTHVAGIAAALTGNKTGVAGGCPRCSLLIAKVVGREGAASVSDVAEGIVWSVNNGAKVINLSLGSTSQSTARKEAVQYALRRGVVVVAAAGNFDSSQPVYPAAYRGVLGVTATGPHDGRVQDYSRGYWVDVAAPGVDILSTSPGGYDRRTGTSIASPHVAALAGLLAAQRRSAKNIKKRILSTAVDLGESGRDPYYGAGRIDADRATRK